MGSPVDSEIDAPSPKLGRIRHANGNSRNDGYNWISGRAELFAEAYDLKYAGPEEGELEYLLRHIRSAEGPTLELACGTGRILIPLAEQGIEMTGIDVSEDMLERCRQKCAEKNLKANLHIQAMQELDLEERFGVHYVE